MDDAINTSAWRQPNTFMDVISPRAKSPGARSAPERSSTLMRTIVKKPVPEVEDELVTAQEQLSLVNSRPDLSESASLTDRSPLISRYSPSNYQQTLATDLSPEADPVPIQAFPSMETAEIPTPQQSPIEATGSEAVATAIEPTFNILGSTLQTPLDYTKPLTKSGSKWQVLKRISGWSVVGVVAVGVIAGGIFVNANISKLELYLASSRAGFSATLPGIKPSGYGLSGISTASGVIEASYKSNIDSRSYSISEKPSSMTSSALLSGYVQNKAGMNFQTINTDNNTIYVYGGHDATWLNSGIWYVVQDNNSLSDHQIINIADSM